MAISLEGVSSKPGRKVVRFERSTALSIMARVADGATLASICKEHGTSPSTFRKHVLRDKELREAWEVSKELRAHSYFDQAVDLANKLANGAWGRDSSAQVRALDAAINTLKWAAGRLSPKDYGDRLMPSAIVPIQIVTNLNLDERQRPKDAESIYQLSATVVDPAIEPSGPIQSAMAKVRQSPPVIDVEVEDGENTEAGTEGHRKD